MEEITLVFDSEKITYYLLRKSVKNINVRIKSDGIYVSAGFRISREKIDKFLIEKGQWLLKHLDKFKIKEEKKLPPRELTDGEQYKYLGKYYTLSIAESSKPHIEESPGTLQLTLFVKDKNSKEKKRLLINKWYKHRANDILSGIFDEYCNRYCGLFEGPYTLKIRTMKSRWGSCNARKKTVTLNANLIFAANECIEYVVLHELCHFRYNNHGKGFYRLLESLMPDYKKRKKILNAAEHETLPV